MAETLTDILWLSPINFVFNIRHQHRCNRHEQEINFNKDAIAGHVLHHVLGDETASPDAEQETAADNLHNTYSAMPEDRQRRFWVRFFYCKRGK